MRSRRAQQSSLFPTKPARGQPLSDRMRPRSLDELVGQEHLLGPGKLLTQMAASHTLHSVILWGPPGSGKTTLARLVADQSGAVFKAISAVLSGVADLREIIELARRQLAADGQRTV